MLIEPAGGPADPVRVFVGQVAEQGIDTALREADIPAPSRAFTATTFPFLQGNQLHQVAAACALGREHIILCMLRAILERIGVTGEQAPLFHCYLNRHIHLDEDFHAPLSLRLRNRLCDSDPERLQQAVDAANTAVEARLAFWDGVHASTEAGR